MSVSARAALEEVDPAAADELVAPAQPAKDVGPRRPEEPVVPGRPGHHARAGYAGSEQQTHHEDQKKTHALDGTRAMTPGLHPADYDPVP